MSVQYLEVAVVLDVLDFLAVVTAVVRVMYLLHLHLVHVMFLLHLHLVQLFTNIIIWKFLTLTQPRFVGTLLSVLAVSLPFRPCSLHGTNHFLFLLPREESLVASPLPVPRPQVAKATGP